MQLRTQYTCQNYQHSKVLATELLLFAAANMNDVIWGCLSIEHLNTDDDDATIMSKSCIYNLLHPSLLVQVIPQGAKNPQKLSAIT